MQQCFMFIDTGNGWTPVNDSAKDIAALDSFVIDWGSDSIDEQPEPAVMSFTLRDRTGRLAGQALTLVGMKVVVQFSNQPRWMDLTPAMGCWRDLRIPIDSLHKTYSPDSPDSSDSPSKQCSPAACPPAAASNRPATADGCSNSPPHRGWPYGNACNPKDRQTRPRNGTARTG